VDSIKDGIGAANSAKYLYQSARVAQGLEKSTKITNTLGILKGTTDIAGSHGAIEMTTSLASGAGHVSKLGQVAGFAAKALPVISKASAVVGGVYGAYEVSKGIGQIRNGNSKKGKENVVSGTADMVTTGALAVAGTSAGTVVGLPVAAVALGVAGFSQGVKYSYKYREQIGKGMNFVADTVSQGYKNLKGAFSE
jgi:hypothetical protein